MKDADEIIASAAADERPTPAAGPTEKKNRYNWRLISYGLHQFLCLAWLGPAIALLYLNFSEYVVGASIGCFSCRLNPFSSATFDEEAKLDKRDHTALGGLQFASKAMEIWFMIIAAGIIYDLLVLLTQAGRNPVPVGMIARYVQFGDILGLMDYPKGTKSHMHRIFLIFVGCICIIVNLMGPSTAVLMIPAIQWRETSFRAVGTFSGITSEQPPRDVSIGNDCTTERLESGNFSCTASPYEHSLDQLFASIAGSLDQIGQTEILFDPVVSQERQVSFIVNTTDPDLDWIPSRQVAREMSDDYIQYSEGVKSAIPDSNYSTLSNSLSTILIRQGPTFGLAGGCYRGSLSTVSLGNDKSVRCYGGWDLYTEKNEKIVRCIQVGSGWSGNPSHSRFSLGDFRGQNTTVDAYFSGRVYTPTGSGNSACYSGGQPRNSSDCDWNKEFLAEPPNAFVRNTSTNVMFVEYSVQNLSTASRTVWCDDISYLGFQSYSMDPSPFSNFIRLTQLENADPRVKHDAIPIVVHTDWLLAGWSVSRGGTVDGTRIAAQTITSLVKDALGNDTDELDLSTLNYMDGIAVNQALSMINYFTIKSNGSQASPSNENLQSSYPTLFTSAKLHVWAYGLGSRTSVLGTVIVIIGSLCVLTRTLLALLLLLERQGRYTTPIPLSKLLLAAIEHVPPGPNKVEEKQTRFSIQKRTVSFSHMEG